LRQLPVFAGSPEHLRRRQDLRLRLALCANDLRLRYGGQVWLVGSGLRLEEPADWDVRVIVDSDAFDAHDHLFWGKESVARSTSFSQMLKANFDVRVYPSRLWYVGEALSLTSYESVLVAAEPRHVATAEEIEANRQLIEKHKDNPDFHVLLGALVYMRGDKVMATQAFMRALQLNPQSASAWLNLGNVFYDMGEFRKAAIYFQRAIALKADYAKAFVNLANTLVHLGAHAPALQFYDRAIELDATTAAPFHNKANCLTYLKRFEEAEVALETALGMEPWDEKILNTLGNLRTSQGDDYAAGAAYSLAIAVAPRYATLYTNLGNIFSNMGRAREAIVNYERGLILESKNPGVRYNLALAYLRCGNYRLGWKVYEGRFGFKELDVKPRKFTQLEWKGEDLAGKRILIHAEQGLGDTFQFCRYVPLVARLGGVVYFEVQHRLQRLMSTVDGVKLILTRGLALPEFDLHCALMSMPAIFKTDVHTVPMNIPYVRAWAWEVEEIRKRFPQQGMRIGIGWAGNPKYKKDKERSFSLSEFAALGSLEGVVWFSLQKGSATQQLEKYRSVIDVIDASSDARDFAETAALIETMDLIITSDSSPAHLAGAMGKEVWLLLSYLPDWRWMDAGDTTPWYPNMRLFRQTSPGDWAGVFARVRAALADRLLRGEKHDSAAIEGRQT
jgi:tetratricopeptide (TPR) repeat protein